MNDSNITEGESIGWIYDESDFQDDRKLTEHEKMVLWNGHDPEDDLSYISNNEWANMRWRYRNRHLFSGGARD